MSQSNEGVPLPRVERRLNDVFKVLHYIGMSLIVIMMLVTVVHSIGRYGLGFSVPGIIELSSYMLVSASFLLLIYTMAERRHIGIGLIVDHLSERAQRIIDIFGYAISLAVAIVAAWYTFVQALYMTQQYMMHQGQASSILSIQAFPFYYVATFGWGMLAVATAIRLVDIIMRR